MKTILTILALVMAGSINAATIQIELNPPQHFRVSSAVQIPFDSGITALEGQSLSLDITFANNEFVRLLQNLHGNHSFEIDAWLLVSGDGFLPSPSGISYTIGADGSRNSPIHDFSAGGGGLDANGGVGNFGLGYVFPLFADNNGTLRDDISYPFDLYGLHLDITLPSSSDYTVVGTNLFLGGGGSPAFVFGPNTPDGGATLPMLGLGLTALLMGRWFRSLD